jgi:hypothetical protein
MYTTWRKRSCLTICPWTGIITMAMVSTMAGAQAVKVTPGVITVDQATHTAKVQFTNTTNYTLTISLELKASAPEAADSAKRDSLARFRSLSAWITNMPAGFALAPHETRTVALNLAVPTSLDEGEYSSDIVVKTWLVTSSSMDTDIMQAGMEAQAALDDIKRSTSSGDSAGGGSTAPKPSAATKIVYHARGKQQKQTP